MLEGEQYNIACEHVPFEWIGDIVMVQRLNAVRLVSIIQFVYAILAYALTFVWGWSNSNLMLSKYTLYIQAIGGISVVSIIAGIIMRIKMDGDKTLTQVKVYTGLTVLELLLWGARMTIIILYYHNDEWSYQGFFATCLPNFFVLILLLTGMSVGAKVIHRATRPQYTLLSDGKEESPEFRTALHFYPLRIVSFIQLAYTAHAFLTVFLAPTPYDLGTTLLVTPAAGALTVLAGLSTFFLVGCVGARLLTYYAIMVAIDAVTGVVRGAAGLLYIVLYLNKSIDDPLQNHQIIVSISVGTAFPLFYWVLGVITAYRTRINIDMDTHMTSEDTDRVYGI